MKPQKKDIPEKHKIDNSHPALYIVPQGCNEDNLPSKEAIKQTVVTKIEDEWKQAQDFVLDIQRSIVELQDETPPTDPIAVDAIVIVFDQVPATMTYGYEGPFRLTMEAINAEYSDIEIWIDAVPSLS